MIGVRVQLLACVATVMVVEQCHNRSAFCRSHYATGVFRILFTERANIMTDNVYILVTRIWTPDMHNTLDSYTVDSELFREEGKAKHKATQAIGKVVGCTLISWGLDENGHPYTQFHIDGKTHAGDPCKQVARWEVHAFSMQPVDH